MADAVAEARTVSQALGAAAECIAREAHSQSARLDAELLLADALGTPREALFAAPERALEAEERERFRLAVKRRCAFEPVAYILGRRAFRTIELEVNDNTLIPRPETETLVEVALQRLAELSRDEPLALDIGTGSGNVALAMAAEHPTVRVLAIDFHPAPLDVAVRNARRLGLDDRVTFMLSDVYDDLPPASTFDLIVSNPPYVTPESLRRLRPEIRGWEPHVALRAERNGMEFYERIVPGRRRACGPAAPWPSRSPRCACSTCSRCSWRPAASRTSTCTRTSAARPARSAGASAPRRRPTPAIRPATRAAEMRASRAHACRRPSLTPSR
jgi:release factor glutamine methyltransferase